MNCTCFSLSSPVASLSGAMFGKMEFKGPFETTWPIFMGDGVKRGSFIFQLATLKSFHISFFEERKLFSLSKGIFDVFGNLKHSTSLWFMQNFKTLQILRHFAKNLRLFKYFLTLKTKKYYIFAFSAINSVISFIFDVSPWTDIKETAFPYHCPPTLSLPLIESGIGGRIFR